MPLNYSNLPTMQEAFSQLTPIPLKGTDELGIFTISSTNSNDSTISVVNGGNLLISTQKISKDSMECGVDVLGSSDFGVYLKVTKTTNNEISISTTFGSRQAKEALMQGVAIPEEHDNITEICHVFDVSSKEATIKQTNLVKIAENKIAGKAIIPTIDDIYTFSNILEYFYLTSEFLTNYNFRSKNISDPLDAFWDSWSDFGKAATVAAGGIGGAVIGGLATGGVGAVGGGAAGASIGEKVWSWFS